MIVKKYPLKSKSNDAKNENWKQYYRIIQQCDCEKLTEYEIRLLTIIEIKINAILLEQKTFNKLTAKFNWNNITELSK